jgi:peroxiredoxin
VANLKPGDGFIPFRLPGTDGGEHSPEDYVDGGAVAVIFSCNHCPYVRAWEDRMVSIQADYSDRGVRFLAVNANDAEKYPNDSFESMQERARDKGFNFPYLRDDSQETAQAYGAERTPEVFLFDSGGRLAYHGLIDDNYEDPAAVGNNYLRDAIDAVLEGRQPATADTKPVGCSIKWK